MPKLFADNKLFLLNVFLVAGLIGVGSLVQQNGSEAAPVIPMVQNTTPTVATPAASPATQPVSNEIAPATTSASAAPNTATIQTSSPATSTVQSTLPPPAIRQRSSDDERGGE